MQTVTFNAIEKLDFRTKESYKTLRTNLEFSGKDRRVISITSSTPNEGKTSVSFQLAMSIAEGGKKVILVDADLRKSVLKGRYKSNAARYGLSHYLSGQASISDIFCKTNIPTFMSFSPVRCRRTPVNCLEMMPSGFCWNICGMNMIM